MDIGRLPDLAHRNLIEFWRLCATWGAKGEFLDTGSLLLYVTGSGTVPSYNGVFRLAPSVPADEVVGHAADYFMSRNLPYSVKVRDIDEDGDLLEACRRQGFIPIGDPVPEMVLREPPSGHLPSDIEIRRVQTDEELAEFVRISCQSYRTVGLPPSEVEAVFDRSDEVLRSPRVATLVARVGGAPVAAAQAVLTGEVGGIYWVGTPEGVRGRGLGRAVSQAATDAIFAQGAVACTLQSSAMGQPVYRRLGYEVVYWYRTYFPVRARRSRRR